MIKVVTRNRGIPVYEYRFAKTAFKTDIFKIATYINYIGSNRPRWMFKHVGHTLDTDLLKNVMGGGIFDSFKPNLRNEIRKSKKMDFTCGVNDLSMDDFATFYNHFARAKGFPPYAKERLTKYKPENVMITSARAPSTRELLVVHVYLVDGERASLLHSVSRIHDMEDDEKRKLVGIFNKRLHWEDILHFKSLGYSVYDWGGVSHKYDNKVLMGINAFKRAFGGIERELLVYNTILRETINLAWKMIRFIRKIK
jgi:hypothetical protein